MDAASASRRRCPACPSRLPVVHAAERYGLVWLCLDEPAAGIPVIAEESNPRYRRINNPVEVWAVSATRMADNFMDISHFPWVHLGTFGREQDTLVPKIELESLDDWFYGYRYDVEVNNPESAQLTSGQQAAVLHRRMTTGFSLPFAIRSTIHYDTGLDHILLLLSTPIDDVTSYFTFVVWRNDDFSVPADEIVAFDRAIGAEDKAMLEQIPGVLPLDITATASAPADRPSVEWRRRFAALLS